jgi:hypothetical protein
VSDKAGSFYEQPNHNAADRRLFTPHLPFSPTLLPTTAWFCPSTPNDFIPYNEYGIRHIRRFSVFSCRLFDRHCSVAKIALQWTFSLPEMTVARLRGLARSDPHPHAVNVLNLVHFEVKILMIEWVKDLRTPSRKFPTTGAFTYMS